MKKTSVILAAVLSLSMLLTACGNTDKAKDGEKKATPEPTMSAELKKLTSNTIDATIELENGDEINLELYPDVAPETVENFIELAEDGFYDGTIFHRVIEGFVIQGGGYDEDLNSLKASTIKGEFTSNGFENELMHTRGVISMARAQDPDSASSQFFIVQEAASNLDGEYAAFGKVKDEESLDVVDDIASVKTGTVASAGLEDVPVTPVVIKTIKIDDDVLTSDDDKDSKKKSKDTDDDKELDIDDKGTSSIDMFDDDDIDSGSVNHSSGSDKNSSSSSSTSSPIGFSGI